MEEEEEVVEEEEEEEEEGMFDALNAAAGCERDESSARK